MGGIIRDIEIDNKQPVQFFDNFYNVLIKLTMDIRLSCKIVNKTKFLSNVGGFKDIMTKKEFAGLLSKSIGSKIYAYLSSFVVDKGVSYLHMSLYKHDIEEYMIDEFNIDLETLGLELTSIELKNIEFEDEEEFKAFEANLLEKSRMNILGYSYEDKMNKDIKYHEDIEKVYNDEGEA